MTSDGGGMNADEMGRRILSIESKVDDGFTKVNGRLRTIELWRARMQGAWVVASLVGPVITGLIVAHAR